MRVELGIWTRALAGEATIDVGRELSVGGGEDAELEVPGADLEPLHFNLRVDERGARIVDLGSARGVLLDGRRIDEAVALQGNRIEAAGAIFAVRYAEASARAASPSLSSSPSIRATTWRSAEPHRAESEAARSLLTHRSLPLYAILDAARDPAVLELLRSSDAPRWCLYPGEHAARLADAAPYLVRLPESSPLLRELLNEGWGRSFGVYFTTRAPVERVLTHLRYLLFIRDEDGQRLYFRYYDPRVLRDFLPIAAPYQADLFFGAVRSFYLEGEDPRTVLELSAWEQRG